MLFMKYAHSMLGILYIAQELFTCFHIAVCYQNHTESNIEDFLQSLKHQNIVLEVDDFENRNATNSLSYNGAIIVSGRQKVCFSLGFYICNHTYIKGLHFNCFKTIEK